MSARRWRLPGWAWTARACGWCRMRRPAAHWASSRPRATSAGSASRSSPTPRRATRRLRSSRRTACSWRCAKACASPPSAQVVIGSAQHVGALDGEAALASEPEARIGQLELHQPVRAGSGLQYLQQMAGWTKRAAAQVPDLDDRGLLTPILVEPEPAADHDVDVFA